MATARARSGSMSGAYDIHDLPFARESPYFAADAERHCEELRAADEHLAGVASCANASIAAMQSVGQASQNLGQVLEKTPPMFQARSVIAALATVLYELASAQDVLAESLELSVAKPLSDFRGEPQTVPNFLKEPAILTL